MVCLFNSLAPPCVIISAQYLSPFSDDYLAALSSFHVAKTTHEKLTDCHILFNVQTGRAVLISLSDCNLFRSFQDPEFRSKKKQDKRALRRCVGAKKQKEVKDCDADSDSADDSEKDSVREGDLKWIFDRGVWYEAATPECSQASTESSQTSY